MTHMTHTLQWLTWDTYFNDSHGADTHTTVTHMGHALQCLTWGTQNSVSQVEQTDFSDSHGAYRVTHVEHIDFIESHGPHRLQWLTWSTQTSVSHTEHTLQRLAMMFMDVFLLDHTLKMDFTHSLYVHSSKASIESCRMHTSEINPVNYFKYKTSLIHVCDCKKMFLYLTSKKWKDRVWFQQRQTRRYADIKLYNTL